MASTTFCIVIPLRVWPAIASVLLFFLLWLLFWFLDRGPGYFYFDAQDFARYANGGGRKLPVAASTGTFEPHLKNYVGVMNLLITVAAASIAFGSASTNTRPLVLAAKIFLAFAVLYGVLFSGFLQFFYEQYSQNVTFYNLFRYTLIQALGFSSLVCFVVGYLVWAFNLG